LNLTFETREGILKHCSKKNARTLGEVGKRFLHDWNPSLEAQVANLADEIAYNNHDVDDGLRSGLITLQQLEQVSLFATHLQLVLDQYPKLAGRRLIHETIRRMINALVTDLCQQSGERIAATAPKDIEAVRNGPPLISFSDDMQQKQLELKQFLRRNLYQHYRVQRMSSKASRIVRDLFEAFKEDAGLMPDDFQIKAKDDHARAVADYIAGMTDRYASVEYRRLFAVEDQPI
jgi:dGTPase